jgi:hypothetical protein
MGNGLAEPLHFGAKYLFVHSEERLYFSFAFGFGGVYCIDKIC